LVDNYLTNFVEVREWWKSSDSVISDLTIP